jgi:hypothetical protein
VQNIDMMELTGFCRNCLASWMFSEADAMGLAMTRDACREVVYGMPYAEWKTKHQRGATAEQVAALAKRMPKHWSRAFASRRNDEERMMTPDVDVSTVPTDPTAAIGYNDLYALWEENEQRDITPEEFRNWIDRVRGHPTQGELAIFDGIFVERSFSKAQVKVTANLYKVLHDRHSASVSKVDSSLG